MVQAHAPNRNHTDWRTGVALCAECHSREHPNVPHKLFFTRTHQPYWYNVSANALSKVFGCSSRTVIRQSKKLGILFNCELSIIDAMRLQKAVFSARENRWKEYRVLRKGGSMLHVVLALDREQAVQIKLMAIRREIPVKDLITQIVVRAIRDDPESQLPEEKSVSQTKKPKNPVSQAKIK